MKIDFADPHVRMLIFTLICLVLLFIVLFYVNQSILEYKELLEINPCNLCIDKAIM